MRTRARSGTVTATAVLAVALGLVVAACAGSTGEPPPQVPDGDPGRGAALIGRYGCGSCHVIPGIREADGKVGPPLTDFAERQIIAGQVPNTPDNLVRWLMDPPSIEPGTAMPNLGVTAEEARDIAAYLYQLG